MAPTLREERRLLRCGHRFVAGMDEVGRGALAGPVTVGVVVVDEATPPAPAGVRDSKLLTPAARVGLVPHLRGWARSWAVGHAQPREIDRLGIIGALRLAGRRALAGLCVVPGCLILDGAHDWLSEPPVARTLFDLPGEDPEDGGDGTGAGPSPLVRTMVKADRRCAAVAAASVLAKVERDQLMTELAEQCPEYRWDLNKGYAAPDHVEALRRCGVSVWHRTSWRLPGLEAGGRPTGPSSAGEAGPRGPGGT